MYSFMKAGVSKSFLAKFLGWIINIANRWITNSIFYAIGSKLFKAESPTNVWIKNSLIYSLTGTIYSRIEKLYCELDEKWLYLTEKIQISDTRKILGPYLFPLMILAYFSIAKTHFSFRTLISIGLGLASIIIGLKLGSMEGVKVKSQLAREKTLRIGYLMMVIGYFSLIYELTSIRGLPLLNEELRRRLLPIPTMLSWTIVPGTLYVLSSKGVEWVKKFGVSKARFKFLVVSLISLFSVSTLAYRTETVSLLIGIIIIAYFSDLIRSPEIPAFLAASLFILVAVTVVRYHALGLSIGALQTIITRDTITTSNYDILVERFGLMSLTSGSIHLSVFSSLFRFLPGPFYSPRRIMAYLIRGTVTVSMTTTIFGPLILDFGIAGMCLILLIIGYLLSFFFNIALSSENLHLLGPYATIFSYLSVSIETGLLDFNVYIYLLISSILLLKSLERRI